MTQWVHVAVGVVLNADGKVLLARRPEHVHQGGLWEFPGGKVETNESLQAALSRELKEEIGIDVGQAIEPVIQIRHQYSDKNVFLDVWTVKQFRGDPSGREGQPLVWVDAADLLSKNNYPLPTANAAIVKALNLPDRMAITGAFSGETELFNKLSAVLNRGVRLIQFRAPHLSMFDQQMLIASAANQCEQFGARLLCNARSEHVFQLGAHGYHLSRLMLDKLEKRPCTPTQLLGASCHNLRELQKAESLDVDYVTLSPVMSTASHLGAESLGWEKFKDLVAKVNVPVFALGGMSSMDIAKAKSLGGQGIAAITEFWN